MAEKKSPSRFNETSLDLRNSAKLFFPIFFPFFLFLFLFCRLFFFGAIFCRSSFFVLSFFSVFLHEQQRSVRDDDRCLYKSVGLSNVNFFFLFFFFTKFLTFSDIIISFSFCFSIVFSFFSVPFPPLPRISRAKLREIARVLS